MRVIDGRERSIRRVAVLILLSCVAIDLSAALAPCYSHAQADALGRRISDMLVTLLGGFASSRRCVCAALIRLTSPRFGSLRPSEVCGELLANVRCDLGAFGASRSRTTY